MLSAMMNRAIVWGYVERNPCDHVERPKVTETTALGAAFLAGLHAGLWPSLDALSKTWALDRAFRPAENAASRDRRYAGWKDAVRRVRSS